MHCRGSHQRSLHGPNPHVVAVPAMVVLALAMMWLSLAAGALGPVLAVADGTIPVLPVWVVGVEPIRPVVMAVQPL